MEMFRDFGDPCSELTVWSGFIKVLFPRWKQTQRSTTDLWAELPQYNLREGGAMNKGDKTMMGKNTASADLS